MLDIDTINKQAAILPTWLTFNVVSKDPNAPANGFAYLPAASVPQSSVVVYLKGVATNGNPVKPGPCKLQLRNVRKYCRLTGVMITVYISPTPVGGSSKNQLIPRQVVKVVFKVNTKTGTMTNSSSIYATGEIDLTAEHDQTWELYKDGAGDPAWRKIATLT